MDCMTGMKEFPDNYFELAIVDPPYGINRSEKLGGKYWKQYKKKKWDNKIPSKKYFKELFRVSEHQIIWGANYFTKYLPKSMGWVFWDKGQDLSMSDGELAYTSFDKALRRKTINRCKISENGGWLHPTQKPVALYGWLLNNYAKKGDKILDTHLGSGSSVIACIKLGFDYIGFEIDKEYFENAKKRIKQFEAQTDLFRTLL